MALEQLLIYTGYAMQMHLSLLSKGLGDPMGANVGLAQMESTYSTSGAAAQRDESNTKNEPMSMGSLLNILQTKSDT